MTELSYWDLAGLTIGFSVTFVVLICLSLSVFQYGSWIIKLDFNAYGEGITELMLFGFGCFLMLVTIAKGTINKTKWRGY